MVELRVVTWNAEGMFAQGSKTRRASPVDAINVIKKIDADIVVVPEFGRRDLLLPETLEAINDLSYHIEVSDYNDERVATYSFAILSKLPIIKADAITLAGTPRQALFVGCQLPDGNVLNVLGIHLDDRAESIRMQQVASISQIVESVKNAPLLVMGDFNAMSKKSCFARCARSRLVGSMVHYVPHRQLRSMLARVTEMATGTTIDYLFDHTPLRSLDPGLQRTISAKQAGMEWMPSWRIAKIDWIFGSDLIAARSYSIMNDSGSDHRPVVADITIADDEYQRA